MKIKESVLDDIIDTIVHMEIPGVTVSKIEILSPITLDEERTIIEIPVKIKIKYDDVKEYIKERINEQLKMMREKASKDIEDELKRRY